MAVTLRLTRIGSKKNPHYRLVATDSRSPRDGKFLEILGNYDPAKDAMEAKLKVDEVKKWLSRGATLSPTVASLLKKHGITKVAAGQSGSAAS
jgi:small subunit ribosomal protein S16